MNLIIISIKTITKEKEIYSKNLTSEKFTASNDNHIVKKIVNDERKPIPFNSDGQGLVKIRCFGPGQILDRYSLAQINWMFYFMENWL